MIIRHDELQLAAKLRVSIKAILEGVHDASGLEPFTDTSLNRVTRERIVELISRFKQGLTALGALPIELHADCGRRGHSERSSSIGRSRDYWCIAVQGHAMTDVVPVQDGKGILRVGGKLYVTDFQDAMIVQTSTRKGCPCAGAGVQEEHATSRYIAWCPDPDSRIDELARFCNQLEIALRAAEDKHRRSSIREELLIALLALERLIVPETADETIAVRHALSDGPLLRADKQ